MPAGWAEISREAALDQLSRILDSHQFRTSKRCSLFLRFVVENASEQRFDKLKERTVGVEVFSRQPEYDTNQDPVVRTAAGEVRKRLAQYYMEPEHQAELRISLPAGTYIPEIHASPERVDAHPSPTLPAPPPAIPTPEPAQSYPDGPSPIPPPRRHWGLLLGAVTLLAAGVPLALWFGSARGDLKQFWAPLIGQGDSVIVCVGQPKTYNFQTETQRRLDQWFDHPVQTQTPPEQIQSIPLQEVVPTWERNVALGDALVFSRLYGLFGRYGKDLELRGGRSVSLNDLRGKPVILVGAFNNEWTLMLADELRFYFDVDPTDQNEVVRDRRNPGVNLWKVRNNWPYQRIPEDYAIVSRVLNKTTEQTVVSVAGITQYGTQAAGEFLTNQQYFEQALKSAPRNWAKMNMQVVLSTRVLSGTTGPPRVRAVHFW